MIKELLYRLVLLPPEGLTKDEWIRLLSHVPPGMAVGWTLFSFPIPFLAAPELSVGSGIAAFALLFILLAYQFIQDWRKKDGSWKDVRGYIWGFAPTMAILGIVWRLIR